MRSRCVNCTCIITRLKKPRLLDAGEQILETVKKWMYPRDITGADCICHVCMEKINNDQEELFMSRHKNICISCGKSILRVRPQFSVSKPEMTQFDIMIGKIIATWCQPCLLQQDSKLCRACFARAKRLADKTMQQNMRTGKVGNLKPKTYVKHSLSNQQQHQVLKAVARTSNQQENLGIKVEKEFEYEETGFSNQDDNYGIKKEVGVDLEIDETWISNLENNQGIKEEVGVDIEIDETGISNLEDNQRIKEEIGVDLEIGETGIYFQQKIEGDDEDVDLEFKDAGTCNQQKNIDEFDDIHIEEEDDSIQNLITLISIRRAPATSSRCLFYKCKRNTRYTIPNVLRKRLIADHNYYIPYYTRICIDHIKSNSFDELYRAENAMSTFTADHIEDIVILLRDDKHIDFGNPESIDDYLFKYWFGTSKSDYLDMLSKVPRLNEPKVKIGFTALLCKKCTKDSDVRISWLFKISRTTLKRYMRQAREILIKFQEDSNICTSCCLKTKILANEIVQHRKTGKVGILKPKTNIKHGPSNQEQHQVMEAVVSTSNQQENLGDENFEYDRTGISNQEDYHGIKEEVGEDLEIDETGISNQQEVQGDEEDAGLEFEAGTCNLQKNEDEFGDIDIEEEDDSKQNLITLTSIRRAPASNNCCLFYKCEQKMKSFVPNVIRKRLIADHNYYIPLHTWICESHIKSYSFDELYRAKNAMSTFTAEHIEDIVFLVRADKRLDFGYPETIDDHLFEYWFGPTKSDYLDMLTKVPRLNEAKVRIGFAALQCKKWTKDSDVRISSLFNVPTPTLKRYMRQAKEILAKDYVLQNNKSIEFHHYVSSEDVADDLHSTDPLLVYEVNCVKLETSEH